MKPRGTEIAITGISCNFPGSPDHREFWKNLVGGKDLVRHDHKQLYDLDKDRKYVSSQATISQREMFDNFFFGYRPDEAALMDPQVRLFHEHCWSALEDAGCSELPGNAKVGVFGSGSDNFNWRMYSTLRSKAQTVDSFYLNFINNEEYLASLVAYSLNLRGPCYYVATACSSSLSAIHLACRSLLFRECNYALAGGVSIDTHKQKGYFYEEGTILSSDGHCRPFDRAASGTVAGEGVGVVLLRRLEDAIRDGDPVYAVIRSSAANNDGRNKTGYTTPSVTGQADCIKMAHKLAAVDPADIVYVEAHGTGTKLGDPIEMAALHDAFGKGKPNSCAVGSVKSNMGHLDAAAGVAGLIKTALVLKNKKIPPILFYEQANPEIDFGAGPFYVNGTLKTLERNNDQPLMAGVSSFGIGGTNVHMVLEEAPAEINSSATANRFMLFPLSANSEAALRLYPEKLVEFLRQSGPESIADISYTMLLGRRHFDFRKPIVYENREELIRQLLDSQAGKAEKCIAEHSPVVFMFSGAGSQYPNMGRGLYEQMPVFRGEMDKGFALLREMTGIDYREIIYPASADDTRINSMLHAQPAIFLFGYSLARLLMSFGITPSGMIGHSIGEYVCACIAGVFSLEDALKLVVKRGQLMDGLPQGAMISVSITEQQAGQYLSNSISLAAVNGPEQVVLSGEVAAVEELMLRLDAEDISYVKLYASQAGHSAAIDKIMESYRTSLDSVQKKAPSIPFISNRSGKLISSAEAMTSEYWVKHMRETVLFSKGLQTLLAANDQSIFVELGGGHSLVSLLRQHRQENQKQFGVNIIRHPKETEDDSRHFLAKLGQLWSFGLKIDWTPMFKNETRRRVAFPTYAFERNVFPVDVDPLEGYKTGEERNPDPDDWFYSAHWKQLPAVHKKPRDLAGKTVLLFLRDELAGKIAGAYENSGANLVRVTAGNAYQKKDKHAYIADPASENDIDRLFADLAQAGMLPAEIVHLWEFTAANENELPYETHQDLGYRSLVAIARSFATHFGLNSLLLQVVVNHLYSVYEQDTVEPAKTTLLGAVRVIPKEFQSFSCRLIDAAELSEALSNELLTGYEHASQQQEMALRGRKKYARSIEKLSVNYDPAAPVFRKNGTYLITGAAGAMGKAFAAFLAENFSANLVLTARKSVEDGWMQTLNAKSPGLFFFQADLSDAEAIRKGIAEAETRFGPVHGVLHTAGLVDFGGAIIRRSREDDETVFAPKIAGTRALLSAFSTSKLDFFVNCSSVSATTAPFGELAYVAANIFQDACAEAGANFPVISIEWPTVRGEGAAVNAVRHLPAHQQQEFFRFAISTADLMPVLQRALYFRVPVPVISVVNFDVHLRPASLETDNDAAASHIQQRPELSNAYIAPSTPTEQKLIDMLGYFFGIEGVGVEDNFFELGGDSLKAMVFLKRIRKEFNVNLELRLFFTAPTVKQIAAEINTLNLLLTSSEKKSRTVI